MDCRDGPVAGHDGHGGQRRCALPPSPHFLEDLLTRLSHDRIARTVISVLQVRRPVRLFVERVLTLARSAPRSEFLIHAADVEGLCKGIDEQLVTSTSRRRWFHERRS